uniref:Uncharacterized protein n=1 Tax=Magallana gigas TaxID=29159 RepID=K1Q8R7_MAGGI
MLTRGHLWIGLTAVLRLPAFFILEKWFLSTPGDVWYEVLASTIDGLLYCFLVYHTLRVLISAVNNLVREIKTTSVMNISGVYLDYFDDFPYWPLTSTGVMAAVSAY